MTLGPTNFTGEDLGPTDFTDEDLGSTDSSGNDIGPTEFTGNNQSSVTTQFTATAHSDRPGHTEIVVLVLNNSSNKTNS